MQVQVFGSKGQKWADRLVSKNLDTVTIDVSSHRNFKVVAHSRKWKCTFATTKWEQKTGDLGQFVVQRKKMGSFFILAFKIWKKKLTGFDTLTEIATLRTHRPSQSSRTEESPRASGSFPPPWYQAQSVNQTPSAKRTVAFFYPPSTDKMLKRYIPQSRGEVVVWALSPSGSDLIRPLPLQHSQEANTVGGVMAKTWFLILFVL